MENNRYIFTIRKIEQLIAHIDKYLREEMVKIAIDEVHLERKINGFMS